MKILVACEESQEVTKAFRAKGHEAWSCDLQECSGGHPEWHMQEDVSRFIENPWPLDMMIAFPPCTYLCLPGAHYLHKQPGRWNKLIEARIFFMNIFDCEVEKICIENPAPHRYSRLPAYSQIINPWQFGHEISKRTCLWLKGLPPLFNTDPRLNRGERYTRKDGTTSNSKWYAKANKKERSKTFPGIAQAMAEQWG